MSIKETLSSFFESLGYINWPLRLGQFIILCVMGLGLVGIIGGHWELYYAGRSGDWPHVEGVVLQSRVEEYYQDVDSSQPSYRAVLEYTYQVNGKHYRSDRRTFQSRSLDRNEAEKIVRQHKIDFPVTVYYDRDSPGMSVLERGAHPENYLMVITCYVIFFGGLAGLVYFTLRGDH